MGEYEFPFMRKAGDLLRDVVAEIYELVVPGVTPLEIDDVAEHRIRSMGCLPAFKGYKVEGRTYKHTVCISVNDCVIHGIPNERKFEIDDVVSVDIGLSYCGYYADTAFTMVLGVNTDSWKLRGAVKNACGAGIHAAQSGNRVGDISAAIQRVAEGANLSIVHSFVGHGIGKALHMYPPVPNVGQAGRGALLKPGMAIAIEPMFTLGSPEVETLSDGWSVVTKDKSLAAHYEHTILITEKGPEVLT